MKKITGFMDEIRQARRMREINAKVKGDPTRLWNLRMKFLEQAKKYFGIPYAKKYWSPKDPEYFSSQFLDCCGLVRQVLRDMEAELGFRVGQWNQAYQFDTLPITVEKEEDMKPGDLVFIAATYYNPKSKKQRHDMVHVEIWLGDGPKTIGARWQRGKVQVFDSYQFEAKSYHSPTYIFKSIDTWLMGICQSYCPEHPWRTSRYDPSKRSVFSYSDDQDAEVEEEEEDAEESAGDTDDEMVRSFGDERDFKKYLFTAAEEVKAMKMSKVNVKATAQAISELSINSVQEADSVHLSQQSSVSETLCNKENVSEKTRRSPIGPDGNPSDADTDGQGQNGSSATGSAGGGSSPNKSPKKTGKKTPEGAGDNGGGKGGGNSGGGGGMRAPRTVLASNMQPTFYIGGGNGVALVEEPLLALGWKRTTDKNNDFFKLKWTEAKTAINFNAFREGEQLVNHIPNGQLLTNKMGLLNSLKEYERVSAGVRARGPRMMMSDFFCETYKLDERTDREAFFNNYKPGEVWICKPTGMNQGKGIYLVRDIEKFKASLEERDERLRRRRVRPTNMGRIIQRYIENPLLLEDKKFDVRTYMLIASTTPYLVLYHKGYVRLSCQKYDHHSNDLTAHLTNQYIQKKDPSYQDVKEDTAWSMDKFNDYINENVAPHKDLEQNWVYTTFTKQMQRIITHIFNAVKPKLQTRLGYFDLYGLDFMIDTDMKVYLIEVNVNPALHINCEALKEVIPSVVEETLYVAIECFEKKKKGNSIWPLQSLKNFTVLYDGESGKYLHRMTVNNGQIRTQSPTKEVRTQQDDTATVPPTLKEPPKQQTPSTVQSPAKTSPTVTTTTTAASQLPPVQKPTTPRPRTSSRSIPATEPTLSSPRLQSTEISIPVTNLTLPNEAVKLRLTTANHNSQSHNAKRPKSGGDRGN
ncbi:protein polyglycylase TTLL10 isoform X3 [Lingula anatina]|uniref:Protein polyglycylase TTLL10 isoform X3 n=1 Tax=Lingula anatina TaxID=7574 RepID=A0A1S3IYA0_LINAN|nr:protein polyglycylase TTLL10 isoform X3 [Lingula anatina]|eukprot:XP_013402524.1 protein polyglycylase TTLL10 isoform X3 [Lingula anatina]